MLLELGCVEAVELLGEVLCAEEPVPSVSLEEVEPVVCPDVLP